MWTKRKLDLSKVEFYKLFDLNPYGKSDNCAALFCSSGNFADARRADKNAPRRLKGRRGA